MSCGRLHIGICFAEKRIMDDEGWRMQRYDCVRRSFVCAAIFWIMNLHKESSCKTDFLIKVHKILDFYKKCLKILEK